MTTLWDACLLLFPDYRAEEPFSIVPVLPADIFAFAAFVLEGSGAYHHIAPETGHPVEGRRIIVNRRRREDAVGLGVDWRSGAHKPGFLPKVPPRVQELWHSLASFRKEPVFAGLKEEEKCPRWWVIALQLLMIADEASQDLGFDPANPFYAPIAEMFADEDVLRGRKLLRLQTAPATFSTADRSVVCVMPKSRTPSVGCTLRSLSHHLSLLPGQGSVGTQWITSPIASSDEPSSDLGLLLIPLPYRIDQSAFVGRGNHRGRWGWFEIKQQWLPNIEDTGERRAFIDFVLDLLRQAKSEGRRVDGVILPELALDYALFRQLARALAFDGSVDFLISGVSTNRAKREGNFVAIAPFFLAEKRAGLKGLERLFLIREKHHRWKLNNGQIAAYNLGSALSPKRSWWEYLTLLGRNLDLFVYRGNTSLTTLICEDLARVDPCQSVLRSIGPNLVIALLMDGAQLEGRWPARYATVLADDPGSSVLTFTSLALIERENDRKEYPLSSAIALWKDDSNGVKRLELPRRSDAIYLALESRSKTEYTLDGRSDSTSAHRWVYGDHCGIAAQPSTKPDWLVTGKAR